MKQEDKTQVGVIEELKNEVAILIGDKRVQEDQLDHFRQELVNARETTELIRREKEESRRNYELLASQVKRFTKNRVEVTDAQRVYYAEEVRA